MCQGDISLIINIDRTLNTGAVSSSWSGNGVRSAARYSSYLTNMLIALSGVSLPECVRDDCINQMDADGILDDARPSRDLRRPDLSELVEGDDNVSRRSFLRSMHMPEDLKETCIICMSGPNLADGPLEARCTNCRAKTHARCWNNLWVHNGPQAGEDEKDPQANAAPDYRCPNCRHRPIVRAEAYNPDAWRVRFRFPPEAKREEVMEVRLLDGEELVVHPWVLFLSKTPCQRIAGQIPLYRLVAKIQNRNVPLILRAMREDELPIGSWGPIYRVRTGVGPYWPETWANPDLVRRVGFSVIRNLFGSSDFNHDWCVNQMLALIGREVPLWQYAESHCRQFIQSNEALSYYRSYLMDMTKKKEEAERLKWVKQQLSGPLRGIDIQWFYFFFEHMALVQTLCAVLFVSLFPLSIRLIYGNPTNPFRWTFSGFIWYFLFRLARFCGYLYFEEMPRLRVLNSLKIWKTCSHHIVPPPISVRAKLSIPRKYDVACPTENGVEVYGCIISNSPVAIPNQCAHDVARGLQIRMLFDRPDDILGPRLYAFAREWLANVVWAPWVWYSRVDWLSSCTPSRREQVLTEDNGGGVLLMNWASSIFTKAEAYVGKTWLSFKPRIIQCRSAALLLETCWYFYSLYKWYAKTFSKEKRLVFGPNCNALELGTIVEDMFGEGYVYEADASNWDGSVTNTMLQIEMFFLSTIALFRPPWLEQMLENWTRTSGAAKGITFLCDWARRSGDFWTTLFNTMLNMICTDFIWSHVWRRVPALPCVPVRRIDNVRRGVFAGDDNFFNVYSKMDMDLIIELYQDIGLKIEIIERTNWRELEFCSGKFYLTHRGVKWGLKPFRQLSKFGINFGRHSKRKFRSLLYGNAMSMLPIAGHVPVFGVFLRSIVRTASERGVLLIEDKREEWQINDTVIDEIHPEEELEFMRRYGYTEFEYQKLVAWAESVHIDDFPYALDDELFFRGAMVDCGWKEQPTLSHKNHALWYEAEERKTLSRGVEVRLPSLCFAVEQFDWFPLVEELLCYIFPLYGFLFFATFEFYLGSVYAPVGHGLLYLLGQHVGWLARLSLHLFWNAYVQRSLNLRKLYKERQVRRDGNESKASRLWFSTAAWRKPEVFIFILDCVGFVNNRLTRYAKILSKGGLPSALYVQIRRTKKTVVVVKKRSAPRKNKRKNRRQRVGTMHPSVIGKINPFLASCNGMRSPDNFGYPTATAVCRAAFELPTASVNGFTAELFTPFVNTGAYASPTGWTGSTITWNAGGATAYPMPQVGALAGLSTLYRTVGWGIRITTDLSLTSAQGHLWVCHYPLDMRSTFPYYEAPTTEASIAQMPLSEKFSLVELAERPLIVPGRAFDDAIYRFRDSSNQSESVSNAFLESAAGWCGICVFVVGAPGSAASVLNVELINHIEYIQDNASVYGFIDAVPGIYDEKAMELGSRVEGMAPVGLIESAVDSVSSCIEVAGRLVAGGVRVAGAMARAYSTAGQAFGKRGFLRGPANSPFAAIEYKDGY